LNLQNVVPHRLTRRSSDHWRGVLWILQLDTNEDCTTPRRSAHPLRPPPRRRHDDPRPRTSICTHRRASVRNNAPVPLERTRRQRLWDRRGVGAEGVRVGAWDVVWGDLARVGSVVITGITGIAFFVATVATVGVVVNLDACPSLCRSDQRSNARCLVHSALPLWWCPIT